MFDQKWEKKKILFEWGSTAQNLIARQSIGQHFWQEINCSTQNFSTAQIKLSRAQPDSTSWQKSDNWSTIMLFCSKNMTVLLSKKQSAKVPYTIFFTINCVEQLIFYKIFVDQLQFKQLIFLCLKVKLLKIHVRQNIFDFRPVFTFFVNWSTCVNQLIFLCQPVFLSYRISSSWSSPFYLRNIY
jgi:hypothetical protein